MNTKSFSARKIIFSLLVLVVVAIFPLWDGRAETYVVVFFSIGMVAGLLEVIVEIPRLLLIANCIAVLEWIWGFVRHDFTWRSLTGTIVIFGFLHFLFWAIKHELKKEDTNTKNVA